MSPTSPRKTLITRLVAEFLVIVVGVLVALAVDGWATTRAERALEAEYLQRLLDDVDYDLSELAFIEVVSAESLEAAENLTVDSLVAEMAPARLTASAFVAANQREPDLSRNTFRELLSSGRIDLLRSVDVRRALAEYDRLVNETSGVWTVLSSDLRRWTFSRVPTDVNRRFQESCEEGLEPFMVQRVCSFDLGGWSAEALRADLLTEEARRQLTFVTHRYRTAAWVTGQLRGGAERLRRVLETELARIQD